MIRFHSKAGADVLMLDDHAARVLSALGREMAPQGIFEPEQIPAAVALFEHDPEKSPQPRPEESMEDDPDLSRRAWPVLQLLRRAAAARHPVLWDRA